MDDEFVSSKNRNQYEYISSICIIKRLSDTSYSLQTQASLVLMDILSSLTLNIQLQCVTCIFNRKVFALWLFSDVKSYGYECVGLVFTGKGYQTLSQ